MISKKIRCNLKDVSLNIPVYILKDDGTCYKFDYKVAR